MWRTLAFCSFLIVSCGQAVADDVPQAPTQPTCLMAHCVGDDYSKWEKNFVKTSCVQLGSGSYVTCVDKTIDRNKIGMPIVGPVTLVGINFSFEGGKLYRFYMSVGWAVRRDLFLLLKGKYGAPADEADDRAVWRLSDGEMVFERHGDLATAIFESYNGMERRQERILKREREIEAAGKSLL